MRLFHAERQENVLARVLGEHLAAEAVDEFAEQDEIDVAIDVAGGGRAGGLEGVGEIDAVLIPAPAGSLSGTRAAGRRNG